MAGSMGSSPLAWLLGQGDGGPVFSGKTRDLHSTSYLVSLREPGNWKLHCLASASAPIVSFLVVCSSQGVCEV
jgi:hypothetical protein